MYLTVGNKIISLLWPQHVIVLNAEYIKQNYRNDAVTSLRIEELQLPTVVDVFIMALFSGSPSLSSVPFILYVLPIYHNKLFSLEPASGGTQPRQ